MSELEPRKETHSDDSIRGEWGEGGEPKPNEIAERLPCNVQRTLTEFVATFGPAAHPLSKVVDAEHLHKIIEQVGTQGKRDFQQQIAKKCAGLFALVVILAFVFALARLLKSMPEVLTKVLTEVLAGVGGLLAGGMGGYGLGKARA